MGTLRKRSTVRGSRAQESTATNRSPCAIRRMPRIASNTPQISSPAATTPGNSAAPNFWPGMNGKLWTCQSTTAPRSAISAPRIASPIFIALLDDADGLHHRAEIGGRLLHEAREFGSRRPGDAEAALLHEVVE